MLPCISDLSKLVKRSPIYFVHATGLHYYSHTTQAWTFSCFPWSFMQVKHVPAELSNTFFPKSWHCCETHWLWKQTNFETQQGIQEESLRLWFSTELVNGSRKWELKAKSNRLNTLLQVRKDELMRTLAKTEAVTEGQMKSEELSEQTAQVKKMEEGTKWDGD